MDQRPDEPREQLPPELPPMDPGEFEARRQRTAQMWKNVLWVLVAAALFFLMSNASFT